MKDRLEALKLEPGCTYSITSEKNLTFDECVSIQEWAKERNISIIVLNRGLSITQCASPSPA